MKAWSMVFFVLALKQLGLSSAEDPTYLVYFPKYLRPGFPIQFVAEILKNPNPVKLTATLSSPAKELNFILESELSEGKSMLLTFTDTILLDYDGTTDFNLTVFGVDTVTNKTVFDRSTDELVFKQKAVSIYIQTDKGIYKRSQTIKFRAVVTTPDLLPYSGKVSYKVIDPDDNIVFQGKNVQVARGVAGSEFAIGRYATLGEWKVVFIVNEYEKSVTISVDEYKLPKFEVEIKTDQTFLHQASTKLSGSISATFTFGQPVQANNVKLEFQIVSNRYYYHRSLSWWPTTSPRTESFTKYFQKFDGEQDFSFTLAELKENNLDLDFNSGDKLEVNAFVTDKNSLVELSDTVTINLVSEYKRFKIEEIFVPKTMKPGLQYTAYLKVSQYDGQTISVTDRASIGLTITSQRLYPTKPMVTEKKNITFEDDGILIISMTVETDDFTSTSFAINSKDYYLMNWSANKFDSPSRMYIQMTTEQKILKPGANITIDVGTTTNNKEYSIIMLARGKIIHQETYVPKSYEKVGSIYRFSYEFFVAKQMSPSVSIVIFFMGDEGDIVSDTITLQVEYFFENTVNVKTSVQRTETGQPVNITVETSADSLVALRAIDRSVILQKEGNDITSENVIEDLGEYGTDKPTTNRWFWYPVSAEGSNSRELFKRSGIIVFTDAEAFMNQTFSPMITVVIDDYYYDDNGLMYAMEEGAMPVFDLQMDDDSSSGSVTKRLPPVVQIRKNFVETWIWEEMDIGNKGVRTFSYLLPDTATTWEISVFAISNTKGLGVAETDPQIIATRDFFISLDLPISMVSGEELIMRATVYNFFATDLNVTLTLENSGWYKVILTSNNTGRSGNVRNITVPKKEGKTESFSVKFLKHGNAVVKMKALSELAGDRIERTVPIKPEGIQREISQSVLIERDDKTADNTVQEFVIKVPDNVVDGSTYGKIYVSGNIMGNSLSNLGNLLKMPSGCGEQNMINFAPDVYISLYLEKVGLLSGNVEAKARKHIQRGYHRELTYQRSDGSFSAFGQSDKHGSTWLTAFVIKCFISAMELRDDLVEEAIVDRGVDFLLSEQEKDGSFREDGEVLHMDLQGFAFTMNHPVSSWIFTGASFHGRIPFLSPTRFNATVCLGYCLFPLVASYDTLGGRPHYSNEDEVEYISKGGTGIRKNLTMTAYVVVAVTEGGYNLKRKDLLKTVDKAMQFLEKNTKLGDDTFPLAIATYALSLSGNNSAALLMDELERRAKYKGDLKYWVAEDVEEPQCEHIWEYHCRTPTSSDIEITSYCLLALIRLGRTDNLMPIVQWIIKQRGSYGGFRSTQDTVMAIQALSIFAGQYSGRVLDMELLVTHSADPAYSANLSVNKDNAIVLQSKELPAASGNVSVTASGVGFADVQVSYLYNIPISGRSDEPFAIEVGMDVSNGYDTVKVWVCTRINMNKEKPLDETGMFIVSMDLPSGYSASDTAALEKNKIAKLVELEGSEITFYFDQITKDKELCFDLDLERFANIAGMKPKGLRASNYYRPDIMSVRSYEIPGLGESSICEVCGKECDGCPGGASKISLSKLLITLLSILTTFFLAK